MTAPLVTPSRNALAEARCSCGHAPNLHGVIEVAGCRWCDCTRDWPDALLTSGVVRAADTLAHDESLVEAVATSEAGVHYIGHQRYPAVRACLLALAAALRSPTRADDLAAAPWCDQQGCRHRWYYDNPHTCAEPDA